MGEITTFKAEAVSLADGTTYQIHRFSPGKNTNLYSAGVSIGDGTVPSGLSLEIYDYTAGKSLTKITTNFKQANPIAAYSTINHDIEVRIVNNTGATQTCHGFVNVTIEPIPLIVTNFSINRDRVGIWPRPVIVKLKNFSIAPVVPTLPIRVLDKDGNAINGATIIINNANGKQIELTTTDSNGIARVKRLQYAKQPITIIITKSGYERYETKVNVNESIDWTIRLERSPYTVY